MGASGWEGAGVRGSVTSITMTIAMAAATVTATLAVTPAGDPVTVPFSQVALIIEGSSTNQGGDGIADFYGGRFKDGDTPVVVNFLTGPLGIAGVAGALILLGRPFGFVALLGVIALMGMIQRNSVILIDQIEQDRARGVPAWDAIVESAVRRLRPIVLTAAAAVLAMIPLSRSVFWGPMAVAIMGGLIVATLLTLLALPAMYAAWFRVKRPQIEVN